MKKAIVLITTIMILILSYDKVSALSYTQEITQVGDTYLDFNNFNNSGWTAQNDIYFRPINSLTTAMIQQIDIALINPLNTSSVDYVAIPFILSPPSAQITQGAINNVICEEWQNVNNNWQCVNFTNNGSSINFPYMSELSNIQFQFKVQYINDDGSWGGWNACDIENNMIMCPTNRRKISYFNINYLMYNPNSSLYTRIGIGAGLRFYNKSSPTQAIQEQTQQQQQQHDNFMNSNQTYEDKQDTNIRDVNETMEYEQAESDLLESLNTNTSFIDSIVINPQASVFIWDIVEVLRNMNPSIILLMGSMLGFGIIKLVLNR